MYLYTRGVGRVGGCTTEIYGFQEILIGFLITKGDTDLRG